MDSSVYVTENAYIQDYSDEDTEEDDSLGQKSEMKAKMYNYHTYTTDSVSIALPSGGNDNDDLSSSSDEEPQPEEHMVCTNETILIRKKDIISLAKQNEKDWNKEFQQLLEEPDIRKRYSGLESLSRDFIYVAETYGRCDFYRIFHFKI